MAKAPSKRKRPSREDFMLKEQRKIESEVFDRPTLLVLARMLKKGIFSSLDFPISTGKEANVFRASIEEGKYLAVKVYKIETAAFFRRKEYLEGDPRFSRIKPQSKEWVYAFAQKEFKNLRICEQANVHAPQPVYWEKNIVVMEFLGEGGLPYQTMNIVHPRSEKDLKSVLEDIRRMYKAGLVHADISEYNLLLGDVPYFIDWGQGVVTRHPNAERFLARDVENVLKYFGKFGYKREPQDVLEWIKG
ncbi:MAG TPA: serine protein kinase RIO [Candidatus Bilamarchaeaceae archaeon]|nr:serine protein kinase RIO [Candidatus Bilamarchaeaceae archaeon]